MNYERFLRGCLWGGVISIFLWGMIFFFGNLAWGDDTTIIIKERDRSDSLRLHRGATGATERYQYNPSTRTIEKQREYTYPGGGVVREREYYEYNKGTGLQKRITREGSR
jgi:hypothetical protein